MVGGRMACHPGPARQAKSCKPVLPEFRPRDDTLNASHLSLFSYSARIQPYGNRVCTDEYNCVPIDRRENNFYIRSPTRGDRIAPLTRARRRCNSGFSSGSGIRKIVGNSEITDQLITLRLDGNFDYLPNQFERLRI